MLSSLWEGPFPSTVVGGSEFILVPGAAYTVREAIPTMEYRMP
ncbi:MAG: hypothetical protein WC291_07550 [Thermodesulfovibrionales bacterium]